MATAQPIYLKQNGFEYISTTGRYTKRPFYRFGDFQKGAIGEVPINSQSGFDDGWDGESGASRYSDEVLYKGRQVCKCFLSAGSRSDNLSFGGALNKKISSLRGESIWFQTTVWIPSEFDLNEADGGGRMKYMRIRTEGVGHTDIYLNAPFLNPGSRISATAEAMAANQEVYYNNVGSLPDDEVPRNQWVNIQIQVVQDVTPASEGGACVMRVWMGDKLLDEITDFYTMHTVDDIVNILRFITYFNATAEGVSEDMWLYVAEFEATNITPTYTDEFGNPKLSPRL